MHGTTTRAIYTIRFSITLVKLFSFFVHPMPEFVDICISEMYIILSEFLNQSRDTQVLFLLKLLKTNRFEFHDDRYFTL